MLTQLQAHVKQAKSRSKAPRRDDNDDDDDAFESRSSVSAAATKKSVAVLVHAKKFICVLCDENLTRYTLHKRMQHLKQCAAEHQVDLK